MGQRPVTDQFDVASGKVLHDSGKDQHGLQYSSESVVATTAVVEIGAVVGVQCSPCGAADQQASLPTKRWPTVAVPYDAVADDAKPKAVLQVDKEICVSRRCCTRCVVSQHFSGLFGDFRGYWCDACRRDEGWTCVCKCASCKMKHVDDDQEGRSVGEGGVRSTASTTGGVGNAVCGVPTLEARSDLLQAGSQDKYGTMSDKREIGFLKMNTGDTRPWAATKLCDQEAVRALRW